jgi:lipoyl-dependent peroxiredoxin
MTSLYTAVATSSENGRDGHVRSSDGLLDVQVRMPKALGGAGGATNPEQLFAGGYAACFHSALKLVGSNTQADTSGSEVVAQVSLHKGSAEDFYLSVRLEVSLPRLDDATAQNLIDSAHQVCPYSNAIRGNVEVVLTPV